MTKKTKILGSASGMLAVAAFSGLIAGATHTASAKGITSAKTMAGSMAKVLRMDTNQCKGQNACKGQGGCKTGDQGCKGQNSCKGKGGCKTATQPSFL
jgi:hypothetical protein